MRRFSSASLRALAACYLIAGACYAAVMALPWLITAGDGLLPLRAAWFLVVFASNKDRRDPAQELHTNFKLGQGEGGFLALVRPDGQTLASAYTYPPQLRDVSYGITEIGSLKGEVLIPEHAPVTVWLPNKNRAELIRVELPR